MEKPPCESCGIRGRCEKKSRMQGVEGMDVRIMGRSKKNLRRISETVTAYNLQRLADMDKTSPGRVVDKLVRDRMIEFKEAVRRG